MSAELVGLFFIVLFGCVMALIGNVIGSDAELAKHRPYCDCTECRTWRAARGKEAEKKSGR